MLQLIKQNDYRIKEYFVMQEYRTKNYEFSLYNK